MSFVREQGTNFGDSDTFQLSNFGQKWPIKFTNTEEDPAGKALQVRYTLVFVLVGFSIFRIQIIKADRAEDYHKEDDPLCDPSSFLLPCKWCRKLPLQKSRPRFVVHVYPHK